MANDRKPPAVREAKDRVDRATGAPHQRPKYSENGDERGEEVAALEREQRRETGESWAGPGMPAATDAQWKGLLIGSLVGGAIGLVLFLPLALIDFGLTTVGRLLLVGVTGALFGGTAGALFMGGRLPELEGETRDEDGTPSDGTSLRDSSSNESGR